MIHPIKEMKIVNVDLEKLWEKKENLTKSRKELCL